MSGRMAPALGAIVRRSRDRRLAFDLAFAAFIAILGIVDLGSVSESLAGRDADAIAYGLIVSGAVALLWRRQMPIKVLGFVSTILVIFWVRDYGTFLAALGLAALYAVAVHAENRRRAWLALAVAPPVLMIMASVTILDTTDGYSYFNAVGMASYLAMAIVVGLIIRNRERIFVDTQRRAERAEAERLAQTQQAVAMERSRIAREMHDVVAHGMSVIAVQAAAAQEIAHTNPDKTVEVLASIEAVGRESLNEMRRMLGVLRTNDDDRSALTPQPTLGDVAGAVAQSVKAGLRAELVISGEERLLSPGVELAGFRIVQEALTNVHRHGGHSAAVTVSINYDVDTIAIEITDDGRGAVSALTDSGGGHGLIGMRERVEIYGGQFSAGPRPGGGYSVRATLPVNDTERRPSVASATPTTELTS